MGFRPLQSPRVLTQRGSHLIHCSAITVLKVIFEQGDLHSHFENHHVLIWHQKLTCLLAFEAAWKGEEALLVITGAEPRRAVHVQLPSNSLEITVLLQWLLMRTNCTTIELPWTLKMNGHCGNLLMGRENPIYLWNRGNASKGWEGLI